MAGRKPVPTEVKKLRGTDQPSRVNADEPKPLALESSQAPAWLPDEARELWAELSPMLVSMRLLTEADRAALMLLTAIYAQWKRLYEFVNEHGHSYESWSDAKLMIRRYPESVAEADAWRRLNLALANFGMSPSSRAKVTVSKDKAADDPVSAWLSAG